MTDQIHELICPQCNRGDELHLLETAKVERKLGMVDQMTTEVLDLVDGSIDDFREFGITCGYCGFTHLGDNWKKILVKGRVL